MKIYLLIFTFLLSLFYSSDIFAHKRAKYNIVIDTDAGVDDFRALTYFLASKEFNINCITTVDGILDPNTGANYISQLLQKYHHEGIPLGSGINNKASKKFEKHALPLWQKMFPENGTSAFVNAIDLLNFSISNESGKTIIIAAGPLSNIADLIKQHPEILPKIDMILWFSDFNSKPEGYNYQQNAEAYQNIIDSRIHLKIISGEQFKYSDDFFEMCKQIKSVYATSMLDFFGESHTEIEYWDDFLPIYLIYPTLFDEVRISDFCVKITPKKDSYYDILISGILNSNKPDQGVVFNQIPVDGFMLRNDISDISSQIINAHGYSEFKIVSLASEIHSHLGIFSILGAKAGLRVMEYLHAGLDEIGIISYAGNNPPISCFNDGLQVGTGSTLGYGSISIDTSSAVSPSFMVLYNGRKIKVSLKPEIITESLNDIARLVKENGLNSEMYWIRLRELSINKYWLQMDRFEIFNMQEEK